MNKITLPKNYIDQIQQETDKAIKRGWDASKSAWRIMALNILCETALTRRSFSVDDFRHIIKASGITTHDNRAMGGLMVTAKNWGWIEASGQEIPSRVGHKVPMQIWRSKIYQEVSAREYKEKSVVQQTLSV